MKVHQILLIVLCCSLLGCRTKPDADIGSGEAIVVGALIVPGVIVVTPIWLAQNGWKIITSGSKTNAYAPEGITISEFQASIEKVEGKQCLPELQTEPDKVLLFKYKGEKANYFGRFKGNHAIEYFPATSFPSKSQ